MAKKDDDSSSLGDSSDNNLDMSQKGGKDGDSSLGDPSDNNLDISQKNADGSDKRVKEGSSSED